MHVCLGEKNDWAFLLHCKIYVLNCVWKIMMWYLECFFFLNNGTNRVVHFKPCMDVKPGATICMNPKIPSEKSVMKSTILVSFEFSLSHAVLVNDWILDGFFQCFVGSSNNSLSKQKANYREVYIKLIVMSCNIY